MFNQKDLLAKLLATEDVTVMHANAKTASFDVKNRVLTLPVWNDMTNETYDHLTGHEVGHALYTPFEGWEKELKKKDMGPGFKSFLNVVEDARIEKLIQRRYPGLRRSFVMSYKKMIADGFFGGDIDKINTYPIIDRINTFFKAGPTAGVLIETDEQVWVDEIEKLETWDEVVDVATRLYEYAKLKKEEENELAQEMEHEFGDEDEDGEFDNDEFGDESIDGESESIEGLESDQTSDDETDDEDATGESNIKGAGDDDVKSKTDEALSQNINANYNNDSGIEVKNIMLNTADVSPLIVDYKTIISDFEEFDIKRKAIGESIDYMGNSLLLGKRGEKLYTKFMANNKKSIAYLVKEFEMKKSAKEYVRATTSKTGVIDPVKMNSYLYNDDIFKKVTTIPEGKSHGMIMYLDWSGSMHYDMKATMDQLLNLVNFSRIVNIPFRVYAFTTGYQLEGSTEKLLGNNLFYDEVNADTVYYEDKFRYLELFNSKMNKKDFIQMQKYMLAFGSDPRTMPYQYQLHGTPLDVSLMGASSLHGMFLKQHRVDIVNTIVLTDGDSHNAPVKISNNRIDYDTNEEEYRYISSGLNDLFGWRFKGQVNVIDPVTKKRYPLTMETNRIEVTDMFLKIYRERTGSTTIGFRILPTQINRIRRELYYLPYDTDYSELSKAMRNDKYCVIPSNGYDKYFGIGGGNDLKTANGAFEVSDDATTAQLRNAFKKASKNKVNSRALLNEFIREVA